MRRIECDVAVIGAGTTGLHAYRAAVEGGADTVIIEQGEGGSTCTRDGCMPSKTLISSARAAHQARNAMQFGIALGSVEVDGPAVMRRIRAERDFFDGAVKEEYHAIPEDKRLHGRARFLARDRLAVGDGIEVTARRIVIATGSLAQVPPALEPVKELVHTNETIFELEDLPASMAVVGGGPLGLELAQAFSRLGVTVTVLDEGDRFAAIGDPEAEQAARDAFAEEFTVHLGVEVEAEMVEGRARLTWNDGGDGVDVDCVLAATGRPPALKGLGLEDAGLPLDDHGTPVFDKTSHQVGGTGIYIAGDAGAWRPVLHEAARGGRLAGTAAAGGEGRPPLPALAVAFTEPNIVEVGTGFADLPGDVRIGTSRVSDNGRARVDGDDRGVVRLYAAADGTLIGGTLIATGAEHLGQSLAIAIAQGMDAASFSDVAWYHPTLEEMLQDAARDIDDGAAKGAS